MLNHPRNVTGEWFVFFNDESERLQRHFDAGGTLEMLNGNNSSALYCCCNEDAQKCLPILMANGAIPDDEVWSTVISLRRIEFILAFLSEGFLPCYQVIVIEKQKRQYQFQISVNVPLGYISSKLCQRSVHYVLFISKSEKQPISSMWRIIARHLWNTRYDHSWFDTLPWYNKVYKNFSSF